MRDLTINKKSEKNISTLRKKILLIAPPYLRLIGRNFIKFPFNLCCLASIIRGEGWRVGVYNMEASSQHDKSKEFLNKFPNLSPIYLLRENLKKDWLGVWHELIKVIKTLNPDVVGITALTPEIPISLKVAQIVKKINPNITIVLGGIHATTKYSSLIKNKNVDFIIRGEGERTIIELLSYLEKNTINMGELDKIGGLSYKVNGKAHNNKDRNLIHNLDELPIPARDLFVFSKKYPMDCFGLIMGSRGCPYSCKFCSSKIMWSNKVRFRSVDNIIQEIKFLMARYDINKFLFLDDDFCINKEWSKKICNTIIRKNLKIRWKCQVRLDSIDDETLDIMKKAGCKQLGVGIESGSEKILKYINKDITLDQIKEKIELISRKKIPLTCYFMVGFPEEGDNDIEKTMRFIKDIGIKQISMNFFVPYPNTEFYNECVGFGLLNEKENFDWLNFHPHLNPNLEYMKYLTDEQKKDYVNKLLKFVKQINSSKEYSGLYIPGMGT